MSGSFVSAKRSRDRAITSNLSDINERDIVPRKNGFIWTGGFGKLYLRKAPAENRSQTIYKTIQNRSLMIKTQNACKNRVVQMSGFTSLAESNQFRAF